MNTTSTTTVHTRVSLSGPPTTTQASSRPAARYGERDYSAASSTSTDEPPDPIVDGSPILTRARQPKIEQLPGDPGRSRAGEEAGVERGGLGGGGLAAPDGGVVDLGDRP